MRKSELMKAVRAGEHDAAKLLLDRSASGDPADNLGYTALTMATMYRHEDTVKVLSGHGPGKGAIEIPPKPGTYDVHLIAAVRVKVPGVKAASHVEAVQNAEERVDFNGLFNRLQYIDESTGVQLEDCVEFNDDIPAAMVDVVGDDEHLMTRFVRDYADRSDAVELLGALKAIKARLNGEWDAPALTAIGPLHTDESLDILGIVENAIAEASKRGLNAPILDPKPEAVPTSGDALPKSTRRIRPAGPGR